MTNPAEWHNTGGNGPARAVWVRKIGNMTAVVEVMPYRCLVTMYEGKTVVPDVDSVGDEFESRPFPTLADAQSWANLQLQKAGV